MAIHILSWNDQSISGYCDKGGSVLTQYWSEYLGSQTRGSREHMYIHVVSLDS